MTEQVEPNVRWPPAMERTADVLRDRDWASSSLGPIEGWPQALKTAVSILVASPVPSSLVWESQFLMFFNDAYVVTMGARPELLGTPIASDDMSALREKVQAGDTVTLPGRPWSVTDQSTEARHLTTHYSPLLDETGRIAGIFAITVGSTNRDVANEACWSSDVGLRSAHDNRHAQREDHIRQLAQANASLRAETAERKHSEEVRLRLLRRLVISQEEERRRIARDLHDHLGQQLTSLRLKIGALKTDCGSSTESDKAFSQIETVLTQLDRDVDFLAWELRPPALDELGLTLVLDNYIREWARHVGILARFHPQGLGADRLAPEIEATLYRVAQEALNNIAKHAKARSTTVVLERRGETVRLIVEDDGIGFCPGDGTDTMIGLVGMRERLALVGGGLDVEPTPGGGTTVLARVPLSLTDMAGDSDHAVVSGAAPVHAPIPIAQETTADATTPDVHDRLKELQRAVASRDDFIATVAHELRNPIAPLMFQVRLAIDKTEQMEATGTTLSAEWTASQLRRIEQRLHRVLQTLDRLLDVSRLSTGRIDLELEHVDFGACVREVLASFEAEFAIARCELRFRGGEGVTGWWDCVRLDQICRNLISNAIRFGAGRPIDVAIEADEQYAILEVQDYGIGISPEQQDQIFERFERGGLEKRSGGFGIGLWVAKNICAAMGGTITVESTIGRGARFTVMLPRRHDRESDRPEDKR
jgi:signal transduction histidine kinase